MERYRVQKEKPVVLPQTCCAVNHILDVALEAEPGAEVWFLDLDSPGGAIPIAGVSAQRSAGSVCLLGQHPAQYSFELLAELSYEHPEDPVWLLVPGESGATAYSVGRAEVRWGVLFLVGEVVEPA
jgi:hypothetical protein